MLRACGCVAVLENWNTHSPAKLKEEERRLGKGGELSR
jgi:hypothetical protein